jgi:putative (di)nucleoside polyphosphate hydrolase
MQNEKYRNCVGIMLINKNKHIFVGQRLDFRSDAWQMPQGGVDRGEALKQAALRELQEETSIGEKSVEVIQESKNWIKYDLPKELVPLLWNGRFVGQTQKWFLMRFNGRDRDININTQKPEFCRWKWCKKNELVDSIVPFKKRTYEIILEEFTDYLD